MLPKKNRADKKAVENIFKRGIFIGSKNINIKYIKENNNISPKISFIVSKTVEKKAVMRNYLKRQGYVVIKQYFNKIPNGFSGVFIFNKNRPINGVDTVDKQSKKNEKIASLIEEDIKGLFNKLKFIK
jgi:ribonuclease P protein component